MTEDIFPQCLGLRFDPITCCAMDNSCGGMAKILMYLVFQPLFGGGLYE